MTDQPTAAETPAARSPIVDELMTMLEKKLFEIQQSLGISIQSERYVDNMIRRMITTGALDHFLAERVEQIVSRILTERGTATADADAPASGAQFQVTLHAEVTPESTFPTDYRVCIQSPDHPLTPFRMELYSYQVGEGVHPHWDGTEIPTHTPLHDAMLAAWHSAKGTYGALYYAEISLLDGDGRTLNAGDNLRQLIVADEAGSSDD